MHKKSWHARKKMHADALKLMLGQRNEVGQLTEGVTTPIKSHLDALHIFPTCKMLPRFGGELSTAEEAMSFKWKMQGGWQSNWVGHQGDLGTHLRICNHSDQKIHPII